MSGKQCLVAVPIMIGALLCHAPAAEARDRTVVYYYPATITQAGTSNASFLPLIGLGLNFLQSDFGQQLLFQFLPQLNTNTNTNNNTNTPPVMTTNRTLVDDPGIRNLQQTLNAIDVILGIQTTVPQQQPQSTTPRVPGPGDYPSTGPTGSLFN